MIKLIYPETFKMHKEILNTDNVYAIGQKSKSIYIKVSAQKYILLEKHPLALRRSISPEVSKGNAGGLVYWNKGPTDLKGKYIY